MKRTESSRKKKNKGGAEPKLRLGRERENKKIGLRTKQNTERKASEVMMISGKHRQRYKCL